MVVVKENGRVNVKGRIRIGNMNHIAKVMALNNNEAYLRISSDGNSYILLFSTDNKNFTELARQDYRYLSTETIGGFTGVHLALFAQCSKKTGGWTHFDWFDYDDKK